MNTHEAQLSSELQELYLENKDTLSDILFLEDESRYFQKLFRKVLSNPVKEERFEEIEAVNLSLAEFQNRRDELKLLLSVQQRSLETMLKNTDVQITIALVDQNTRITSEIRALLRFDKEVKKRLYSLVEQVMIDDEAETTRLNAYAVKTMTDNTLNSHFILKGSS